MTIRGFSSLFVFSILLVCTLAKSPLTSNQLLKVTLRDFIPYNYDGTVLPPVPNPLPRHVDFNNEKKEDYGIVTQTLTSQGIPGYLPGMGGSSVSTHGYYWFLYWWTPSQYSRLIDNQNLEFVYNAATQTWTYSSYRSFFPLNGIAWGDTLKDGDGNLENFSFTMVFSHKFTYTGHEYIILNSEDDTFVYVNGDLKVNNGGIRNITYAYLDFTKYGLPVGKTAEVDIFYAERHVPWATFNMTTNIYFNGSLGKVGGDPHFNGLSGEEFDVMGEPDKWFALVSDVNFQLNALFVKGCESKNFTAIGSIAMIIGDQRIHINLTCHATLNETVSLLNVGSVTPIGENGKYGFIHHAMPQVYYVDTPDYYLKINPFIIDPGYQKPGMPFYGPDCIPGYFNINLDLENQGRTPHGILGQTAHHQHEGLFKLPQINKQGEGEIEGTYKDYIVSDMFATDFKYNRYRFVPDFNDNYEDTIYEGHNQTVGANGNEASKNTRADTPASNSVPIEVDNKAYWDLVKFMNSQCEKKESRK